MNLIKNAIKLYVPDNFIIWLIGMHGKLEEIEGIFIRGKPRKSVDDQGRDEGRLELRDELLERIKRIAGKDSIKRLTPIQNQGDHKKQDIVFTVDDKEYIATLRYNNALTEGSVEDLRKQAKKC